MDRQKILDNILDLLLDNLKEGLEMKDASAIRNAITFLKNNNITIDMTDSNNKKVIDILSKSIEEEWMEEKNRLESEQSQQYRQ